MGGGQGTLRAVRLRCMTLLVGTCRTFVRTHGTFNTRSDPTVNSARRRLVRVGSSVITHVPVLRGRSPSQRLWGGGDGLYRRSTVPSALPWTETALESRLQKRARSRGPVRQALTAAGGCCLRASLSWFVNPALKAAAGPRARVRHGERADVPCTVPAAGWACRRAVI